jgi:hypothetical protein
MRSCLQRLKDNAHAADRLELTTAMAWTMSHQKLVTNGAPDKIKGSAVISKLNECAMPIVKKEFQACQ